ncbi:unnamed protein product [Schistosoma mattheei]|uniref:Uncharacterized protein n=1 Tax=Schistosoma mattheei TaxID=31246 RepID=A0A183PRW2_9TREM|nr:unnamed protein product [Schistosoma mattheei]
MYRYLEEQVTRYRETEPENESTKLMDFIQKKFGCCGVTSAADYGTRSPPKSCTVTKSIQSYSRVSYLSFCCCFKPTDIFISEIYL